ncbi:Hypothetical predicted protein, partial [Xyrichtys novacula]
RHTGERPRRGAAGTRRRWERRRVTGEVCLLMRWIRLGRRQRLAANSGQRERKRERERDGRPNL